MTLPLDPFGRARLPGDFTAIGRVRLLAEAADALEDERLPSPEACAFVGAVLNRWLRSGGRFEVVLGTARRGSHRTAQAMHSEIASSSMSDRAGEGREDRGLADFDHDAP